MIYLKKVSSKVAKAVKEAGYPLKRFQTVNRRQFEEGHGYKYSTDENYYAESPSILHPEDKNTIDMYFRPNYFSVWLWLWREKKIAIPADYFGYENNYWESCVPIGNDKFEFFSKMKDPEEAIIKAIEYLVENNLIN